MATKPTKAQLVGLTTHCLNVKAGRKVYTFDFARYPYFEYCTIKELESVVFDGEGFWWPEADISISRDALENPARYPNKVSLEWWLKNRAKKASAA